MSSVHDVAAYIIQELGPVTPPKLQKLLYYCQAWRLVCDGVPLFEDAIEARDFGPVVPEIYAIHQDDRNPLHGWPQGSSANLQSDEKALIGAVLGQYGTMTASQLSAMTHREDPWMRAYVAEHNAPIDHESLREFYAEQLEEALDLAEVAKWDGTLTGAITYEDLAAELGW